MGLSLRGLRDMHILVFLLSEKIFYCGAKEVHEVPKQYIIIRQTSLAGKEILRYIMPIFAG